LQTKFHGLDDDIHPTDTISYGSCWAPIQYNVVMRTDDH